MDEITISLVTATRFIQDNGFNSPSGRLNENAQMVALALQGQGHQPGGQITVYGTETVAAVRAWMLAEDLGHISWLLMILEP